MGGAAAAAPAGIDKARTALVRADLPARTDGGS
jgi:hypothetical protein